MRVVHCRERCDVVDKMFAGKIHFKGDVEWAARLWMPPVLGSSSTLGNESGKALRGMQSALATMGFVR